MQARFRERAGTLCALVETLKDIASDVNLNISADRGIEMQSMDPSHVSFYMLHLPVKSFDSFQTSASRTIGVPLADLHKVLKCAKKEDIVTFQVVDGHPDELILLMESGDSGRIIDFSLRLLEIDAESLIVPDVNFTATAKMPMAMLQRIVKDFREFDDTVTISVAKEGLKFAVSGTIGNGCHTIQASDDVELWLAEATSMRYSLNYLHKFAKIGSTLETGTLCLAVDVPLMLKLNIGDHGTIAFYLAPKMDDP